MQTLNAQQLGTRAAPADFAVRRRRAIQAAFWSEFIDMFDIYLPVIVLAPVLGYFQPAQLSAAGAAILASLVFVTTLLGRPVGALLFGLLADRLGRRSASIYSVAGFGAVTLLIALLPGYRSIGIGSYWLLVLLRFVDGIFLGGGYTGAMPLAMEYARKERRGLVGGLVLSAFCAAYLAINLLAMLMFALFGQGGDQSAYARFGWRIPFVVGALLAAALALYYRRQVAESELWRRQVGTERRALPLRELLHGQGASALVQVLLLMSGFWLTQNLITLFVPTGLLRQTLHLSGHQVTATLMFTYALLFFSYIGAGVLGQRIGRRRFFLLVGPLIATVGAALLYELATPAARSLPATALLVSVLAVLVTAPWGVIAAYINERFATGMRATGFGLGFSASLILPSFYAFYLNWLDALVPSRLAPAILLCAGGLLGTLGALLGPETRDVEL